MNFFALLSPDPKSSAYVSLEFSIQTDFFSEIVFAYVMLFKEEMGS